MKQTRMKSFVEQSERHYVSVPRHHLWSRIYIILRVLVFHYMSRVCILYAFQCVCTCMAVYMCVSPCTTILSLSLSHCLLSYFLTPFTHGPFALFLFTLFFSRPFALLSPHVYTRSLFPPAFLSLSILLSDIPRTLSSLDVPVLLDSRISTELNSTRSKETTRDRTKIVIVSRSVPRLELVIDSFHPPLRPLARASIVVLFLSHPFLFRLSLPLVLSSICICSRSFSLSLPFSPFHSLSFSLFLSVSICSESSPKILYMVLQ